MNSQKSRTVFLTVCVFSALSLAGFFLYDQSKSHTPAKNPSIRPRSNSSALKSSSEEFAEADPSNLNASETSPHQNQSPISKNTSQALPKKARRKTWPTPFQAAAPAPKIIGTSTNRQPAGESPDHPADPVVEPAQDTSHTPANSKSSDASVVNANSETSKEIPASAFTPSEMRSNLDKDFWIWLGTGINFSSNSQSVPGFSDIQFGAIHGPSSMMKAGFFATNSLGLELGYFALPGMAKSGPAIQVIGGSYVWQTMMADLIVRTKPRENRQSEFQWKVGLQQHQTPFLIPESASSIQVIDHSVTQASLGFEYRKLLKERLRFEWLFRYQMPLHSASNSGKGLNISSHFSFDGSVGAAYSVNKHFSLGVYWYGQFQQYDFQYDDGASIQFSGKQRLFFSNMDLRMGWEF